MNRSTRACGIHTRKVAPFVHAVLFFVVAGAGGLCSDQAHSAAADRARNESPPQERYAEWIRTSQYLTMKDGVKLAIDVHRPSVNGRAVAEPLPVVLYATPYQRAKASDAGIVDFLQGHGWAAAVLKRGYVVASLDLRGRGASFGKVYGGGFSPELNRWDLHEVIEWLAEQPWSNGKIGMGGCSNVGLTQYWAASTSPPHLKSIAPGSAPIDMFDAQRVNGIERSGAVKDWDQMMHRLDVESPAPPVDDDAEGILRAAAIAEHRNSWDQGLAAWALERASRPFRNSLPAHSEHFPQIIQAWNYLPTFRTSRVAVFQVTGWRDLLLDHTLSWHRSLAREGIPQRLIIGPWYHCEWETQSEAGLAEQLRWYDRWLKGLDSGVAEDPVRYYVVGAPPGREWRTATQWPLPALKAKNYFLALHGNEGRLVRAPYATATKREYQVDYSISASPLSTRHNGPGSDKGAKPGLSPVDTRALAQKSLTYTTEPFTQNTELTGTPRMTLWVSSTARDQDFFVYLEEVDQQGVSTLMTDGAMRASHRANRVAPFETENVPYHAGLKEDHAPLVPGVPVKLEFSLYALSNYVKKGHRVRITLNNHDAGGGWDTPKLSPPPTVTIYHGPEHPSSVSLPFIGR